jgi:hypothetical protein
MREVDGRDAQAAGDGEQQHHVRWQASAHGRGPDAVRWDAISS